MTAKCATETQNNPLWDFALQAYALPGMADLLLRLQDHFAADVLWLLTGLWLEEKAVVLSFQEEELLEYNNWKNQVILPIRASRKASKKTDPFLYQALKDAEIQAEKTALGIIYQLVQPLLGQEAGVGARKESRNDHLTSLIPLLKLNIKIAPHLMELRSLYQQQAIS